MELPAHWSLAFEFSFIYFLRWVVQPELLDSRFSLSLLRNWGLYRPELPVPLAHLDFCHLRNGLGQNKMHTLVVAQPIYLW